MATEQQEKKIKHALLDFVRKEITKDRKFPDYFQYHVVDLLYGLFIAMNTYLDGET